MTPQSTSSVTLRGQGMDSVHNLIQDGFIRPIEVNGELYGSLVDIITIFKSDIKNPRQYWKDHKQQILAKDDGTPDPELVANLYQLKIPAADGKKYKTDVAPLWVCVYIAMTINQEFRKRLAKFTAVEIKHRMVNVARGMEWAADTTHAALIAAGVEMTFSGNDPDLEWHQR